MHLNLAWETFTGQLLASGANTNLQVRIDAKVRGGLVLLAAAVICALWARHAAAPSVVSSVAPVNTSTC